MELRAALPRLGDRPAHRIFGCTRSTALHWVEIVDQRGT
jgi:hypothetical protein